MSRARPLVQQEQADNRKVWLLLCGGAAGLFAATLLLENNSSFFPSIARANQALSNPESSQSGPASAASTSFEQTEAELQAKELEERSQAAVLKGLQAARSRVTESDRQ